MCYLSQWVGLIHKLAQGIRSKETIDYTTDGFSVNQICRCEHFVVTNIHAFANSTAHTSQTYCKLIAELLTYGTNASVTQMVNIIDIGFTVNQFNEILDNFNDVLTSQYAHCWINVHIQFTVDAVTTNIAQVIALVTKEEVENYFFCTGIVSRISISQLTVDISNSFLFTITCILHQGVEDCAVIGTAA